MEPKVWRLHMRPKGQKSPKGEKKKTPEESARYALDGPQPFIGIGWELNEPGKDVSKEEAIELAKKLTRAPVRRFIEEVRVGDLVWVRRKSESHAWYYGLYKIIGDYQYRGDEDSFRYDFHHVRSVLPIKEKEFVAGPVANSFLAPSTLIHIGSSTSRDAARCYTWHVCNEARIFDGCESLRSSCDRVLRESDAGPLTLLGPVELEDVVALYLQMEYGYHLVPGTHHSSTYGYEYDLVKRGEEGLVKARVQVKTNQKIAPKDYAGSGYTWYLFTLSPNTRELDTADGVVLLDPGELAKFVQANEDLMPSPIVELLDVYRAISG